MGNKPLFIDHLDTPNADNRPVVNKPKKDSGLVIALGTIVTIVLVLVFILLYSQFNTNCTYESLYNPYCLGKWSILYAPVFALVLICTWGIYSILKGVSLRADQEGFFSSWTKNAHVDDRNAYMHTFMERLEKNTQVNVEIAKALHSMNWQTTTIDKSNTYKQTVEPKDERDMTEDADQTSKVAAAGFTMGNDL